MISLNLVWILTLVIIVGMTGCYLVNGMISYRKSNKARYSFLNSFPHEMSSKDDIYRKRYFVFMIIYAAMFTSILWNTLPFISSFKSFTGLVIVESVFALLNAISFILINLIEAKYVRQHTTVATLYMVSSFGMAAMSAVFSFLLFVQVRSGLHLVYGIMSALMALVQIFIILNPKLKDWAQLESRTDESGGLEFSRPKLFPLAYSEWISFIIATLTLILFLVSLL